jgi:acetamidase/formamidase
MADHTLQAARASLHAHFAGDAAPVLVVESGDTVSVRDVPDVGWGLEPPTSTTAPRRKAERDPARDDGPCLCGPIAVRGAEPGDTLEIAIESVATTAWGWTYAGRGMATPEWNAALGLAEAPLTLVRWTIDAERAVARSDLGAEAPLRPFLGCIGLAPAEPHASGWVPRACGGNMDCRELAAGSRLYLPVRVAGGLLSLGDTHAAQGDGEVAGTAIECGLREARLRLVLHRGRPIGQPRVRTPEAWITLGFGETLDLAAAVAMGEMLDVMTAETGLGRAAALALASAQVSLRVTQVVNPARGVHAVWERRG